MALAVDFYYGLGSRYSYLASTQLERIAAATGCRFDWHPLKSGALMELRGGHPFRGEPASGQYEWPYRQHDAEAWAEYYGVPYREPVDFRVDPGFLALAATAAKRLGAVEAYSRRLFQAIFVEGGAIAEADLIGFAEGRGSGRASLPHPPRGPGDGRVARGRVAGSAPPRRLRRADLLRRETSVLGQRPTAAGRAFHKEGARGRAGVTPLGFSARAG